MRPRGLAWILSCLVTLAGVGVGGSAAASEVRQPARLASPVSCPGCWHPALKVSWQWQLQNPPAASALLDVKMYDVDGFDASKALIAAMHTRGIKAVCYVSGGSWEDWRPDAGDFPASVLGRSNGWPGEKWLDIRRLYALGPIMKARLDMCRAKGFDAVEFDNVDGYQNATGFPLTGADQLRYNIFLANAAHARGLSAFLKNDIDQVAKLLPYFDAELNEQCFQYAECAKLKPFVQAGKPVFTVEYKLTTSQFCSKANAMNFNSLKKKLPLDAWRVPCRGA
ncbi:MAG TPA: endo alpha-1,4 polygalactosaminidase [Actinomycetota bacterium]|nr:endo alpha-1,4 polygalactosaminidase [Actinomycetota bacterium]